MNPTALQGPRTGRWGVTCLLAIATCIIGMRAIGASPESRPAATALTQPTTPATTPATTSRPATTPAATQPITTAKSPVGELLRKWWAEGTAAGNVGDYYDNRDRTHSELNRAPYPQLAKIQYSKEALDTRRDWAAQHTLVRGIVFGNSSTSAGILSGGSNPRMYYSHPRGLTFLFSQYIGSNLYIYPEHQDHDPGHNGTPGYGDVYPTNTPYVIISQGSSGSDQPFMRAIPFTLAAFRPEVKQALREKGLLMPTIQMILRSSMKNLKAPEDYLTARAHPTVFEGANVDDLKMVQMAHAITLETLPPMVILRVAEEDRFEIGKDFFEPQGLGEQLADTPCAIARIWRAGAAKRRLVVHTAVDSQSGKKKLKYHWALLRGDEKRVTIKPLDEAGTKVEITIGYHERRPIAAGSPMESNRVDIAAFVHNGAHWSPPALLTIQGLDSEGRTYDGEGKLLEIGYGVGTIGFSVSNWLGLLEALAEEKRSPGVELLASQLKAEDLAGIVKLAGPYKGKVALKDSKGARELVENKQEKMPDSAKALIERALLKIVDEPDFLAKRGALLAELFEKAGAPQKNAIAGARARLVKLGIAKEGAGVGLELTPLRGGNASAMGQLTTFERSQVKRYQGDLVAALLTPGMATVNFRANYVDPNLSRPKNWRDLYRYDSAGKLIGWTRLGLDKTYEFGADGKVIMEKGPDGAPTRTATVRYEVEPSKTPGPNWTPLKQVIVTPENDKKGEFF